MSEQKHPSKVNLIESQYLQKLDAVEFKINSKVHGTFKILVDKEDWLRILENNNSPFIHKAQARLYVRVATEHPNGKTASGYKKKKMRLHRFIIGEQNIPKGYQVDHINGDTMDNRKSNLRICTMMQNMVNRKQPPNSSSTYRGVCANKYWSKKLKKSVICKSRPWKATYKAKVGSKKINLGTFATEIEAARAYDLAVSAKFGKFALLNFPKA